MLGQAVFKGPLTESGWHPVGFGAQLIPERGINRLRFSAAEDLLDEGARLVDETGRESIGGARRLLAVQATRATHTLESVIALCRIGRGVQAAMLNRSLLRKPLRSAIDAPGFVPWPSPRWPSARRSRPGVCRSLVAYHPAA